MKKPPAGQNADIEHSYPGAMAPGGLFEKRIRFAAGSFLATGDLVNHSRKIVIFILFSRCRAFSRSRATKAA